SMPGPLIRSSRERDLGINLNLHKLHLPLRVGGTQKRGEIGCRTSEPGRAIDWRAVRRRRDRGRGGREGGTESVHSVDDEDEDEDNNRSPGSSFNDVLGHSHRIPPPQLHRVACKPRASPYLPRRSRKLLTTSSPISLRLMTFIPFVCYFSSSLSSLSPLLPLSFVLCSNGLSERFKMAKKLRCEALAETTCEPEDKREEKGGGGGRGEEEEKEEEEQEKARVEKASSS
ncbi:hypothetical protein ALC60_00550, partial [Trachymyrmex zeteki]